MNSINSTFDFPYHVLHALNENAETKANSDVGIPSVVIFGVEKKVLSISA